MVTTLNATGTGSLADAIGQANASPGANTITFALDGTINLAGSLNITDDGTTIDGSGRNVTLAWAAAGTLFVKAGQTTLRSLTMQNGNISADLGLCTGHINGLTIDDVTATAGSGQQNISLCARSAANIVIVNSDLSGSTIKGVQLCQCTLTATTFDLDGLEVSNTRISSGRTALDIGAGGTEPVTMQNVHIGASELRATGASGPRSGFAASGVPLSATNVVIEDSILSGATGITVLTTGSLAADGLLIRGNTITGAVSVSSGGATGAVSGITISGNSITGGGVLIRANAISAIEVTDNPLITTASGPGVNLQSASILPSSISGVTISGNGAISGLYGVLVGSDNAAGHATISGVEVSRNGSITGTAQSGVSVFGLGGATISAVSIEGNGPITGTGTQGIGIGSLVSAANISSVSISNNQAILGLSAGVSIGNLAATASTSGLSINGNGLIRATGASFPAIQLLSGNPGLGNTISDNRITDSATGIRVANAVPGVASGLTVVGNTISGNGTGVLVESGAAAGIVLRLNNITGNGVGVSNGDPATGFDAEQNWWGCAAGPGNAGCDTIAEVLAGSIDFTPWLESAVLAVRTSQSVSGGATAAATGVPTSSGDSGASATIESVGSAPTTVTVSTYQGNPATTIFDVGGGYVDIFLSDPAAVVAVTSNFYYPTAVTGQSETELVLYYFNGTAWLEVRGSGGAIPVKNVADSLDGTVSGGRFTVTFDGTSTPTASELNGTIMTFSTAPRRPVVTVSYTDESTGGPYVPGTWTRGPVVVTFVCAGGSGIAAGAAHNDTAPSGAGNTYPGSVRVTKTTSLALSSRWRCVDSDGNAAVPPAGFPAVIRIDRTAPTCTVVVSRTSVPRNGTPTAVTATVNGTDADSGVASRRIILISPAPQAGGPALPDDSPATWTLVGASGHVFTFTGEVRDNAGNVKTCTKKVVSR